MDKTKMVPLGWNQGSRDVVTRVSLTTLGDLVWYRPNFARCPSLEFITLPGLKNSAFWALLPYQVHYFQMFYYQRTWLTYTLTCGRYYEFQSTGLFATVGKHFIREGLQFQRFSTLYMKCAGRLIFVFVYFVGKCPDKKYIEGNGVGCLSSTQGPKSSLTHSLRYYVKCWWIHFEFGLFRREKVAFIL